MLGHPKRDAIEKLLPLEGQNLIGTLRKAVDIVLEAPQLIKRSRRFPYHEDSARILLNYLTVDDRYNADLIEPSPSKQPRYDHLDEDFCEPSSSFGLGRRTSLDTMKKIVELNAKGVSERSIQAKYRLYTPLQK